MPLPCAFRLTIGVLLAACVVSARAEQLMLDAQAGSLDAWPATTILVERDAERSLADVLAQRADFVRPEHPHANLGPRQQGVWLRVPLVVRTDAPRDWLVVVDYPSLDRLDLYLTDDAGVVQHARMGRGVPYADRPWPSSVHATPIALDAGRRYELFARVATTSTMVVPLSLATREAFHTHEARHQVLQGLLAGAALCLLVYSLAHWLSLREPMFLHYALTLAGTTVFFVAYRGLGSQHLWGESVWLSTRAAPLAVLLGALPGGFLFIDRALRVREISPPIALALRAGATIAVSVGVTFVADLVDYRVAQAFATALGPLPMLLAVPASWRRARDGDRIGFYMLLGWSVYAVGTLTMAGLLRGWLPANVWTLHAFQLGSLFEMMMWMRVLGVRTEGLRTAAQRAALEHDALRSLALTDALTGLLNRRGLSETLGRALPATSSQRMAAVYLLDLDGFKAINDRLGHDAGDEVLIEVGGRLQALMREGDVVARLGGDEFVAVATGLRDEGDARAIGQKIFAGFRDSPVAAARGCGVGATIGYALAPLDGHDAAALLKLADAAMYEGKQAGRARLVRAQAPVVARSIAHATP